MSIQKAEMSIEQIENGQIVEHVAYPYVEYEHVTMENGMDIMSMIRDDVSTPMVTHNATSWKVGQGDSDVSESIVDSSVASMAIKGQTYQNILPSPSLRNSMTNGKTMQKLSEGYDSVNTVDGVSKSAILSGNTLVNLVPSNYSIDIQGITTEWQHSVFLYLPNKGYNVESLQSVKSNAKYLLRFYVERNTVNNKFAMNNPANNSVFSTYVGVNAGETGWFNFILTSKEIVNESIVIRFQNATAINGDIKVDKIMLIEYVEGMENWDIPYFEGMQSVKMPVLKTTGKNLINYKNYNLNVNVGQNPQEIIVDEQGLSFNVGDASWKSLWYDLYLEKGENYTLSFNTNLLKCFIFKSKVNTYVSSERVAETPLIDVTEENIQKVTTTFVAPSTGFIRVRLTNETKIGNITLENLQIEKNKSATPYEPYKSNTLSTPEDLELRGIGEVKDELNLMTGEMIQRIGEIVLDGSDDEGYSKEITSSGIVRFNFSGNSNNITQKSKPHGQALCDKLITSNKDIDNLDYVKVHSNNGGFWIYQADKDLDVNTFKEKLKINPLTIKYQLKTESVKTVDLSILDQDNQPTTQLNSFANGYIQVSSQGLIPSVDYEVPTSNSYHVDLMKPNTQYTMKNMQGTFTIDNIQYNASTNGTFTSPSALTNNFMITSVAQSQPMLLEGDVREKDIPYFKGIKSAFEDESKIEVLSTGKNLLSPELYVKDNVAHGVVVTVKDSVFTLNGTVTNYHNLALTPYNDKINLKLEKGKHYKVSMSPIGGTTDYNRGIAVKLTLDDGTIKWLGGDITPSHLTMNGEISWIRLTPLEGTVFNNYCFTLQVEESSSATPHQAHKSNSTKIPLLSPLRGLPNGVYDELIIDRMKKKATLIQRIKSTVFNGSEGWNLNGYSHDKLVEFVCRGGVQMAHAVFSDRFATGGENVERVAFSGRSIYIRILKTKASNVDSFKKWLSQNPLTVQYGLQTPLITEVNLEGYPYVYKGGHIFLNTEIAPITEVTYSINQAHQIESSNEDILRHQKEINHLYELIAQYVQVQYEAELIDIALQG